MNALNFALIAFVAYLIWHTPLRTDDNTTILFRLALVISIAGIIGWRLGGWS